MIKASNIFDPDAALPDLARPEPGKYPVALTIAGFDPSSGAGITADLKTFAAHGIYALAAITALTVQSTQEVRRVEPVSSETLREMLECLAEDLWISGIKIGMLANEGIIRVVSDFLAESGIAAERIILDPVLKSSSGHNLLTTEGLSLLKGDLLPRVGWLTPNIDELAILAEAPVLGRGDVPQAAERLAENHPAMNIVVTGGHLDPPDDFLRTADGKTQWFPGQRIETTATHGTGCAFCSALLARLLSGDPSGEAVIAAKTYVTEAIKAARPIGKGRGPLHHLYKLG